MGWFSKLFASTALAASTSLSAAPAPELPPLPEYASGIQCTLGTKNYKADGIDRNDRNFMKIKLDQVIKTYGEIYKDGWKLVSRAYHTAGGFHNNHELLKPNGEMFASIDTLQISRESQFGGIINPGEVMGYFPWGQYAAHTLDDCVEGNITVKPANLKGTTVLMEGKGTATLLGFAQAAERGVIHAGRNYDYTLLGVENDGIQVNSNTFARSLAKIFDKDIYPTPYDHANIRAPGLSVDLTAQPAGYPKSFYHEILEKPEQLILDRKYYDKFLADLKVLHPASQQELAIKHEKSRKILNPFADGLMWR